MIRIIDKFFRIATEKNAFGETPWKDAAGYCLLKNEPEPVITTEKSS